jgi:2-methylcitrate dehydratase PrpD
MTRLSRRRLLRQAGGAVAALPVAGAAPELLRAGIAAAQSGSEARGAAASADVTGRLARYMAAARDRDLPAQVVQDAKHRILDTFAAMVSGAELPPGHAAIRYIRTQGGTAEASVLTTNLRTSAVNAALANGMFAHADETDDFEPVTKAHPGSAVVPAALAMAEKDRRSGTDFLRAVVLGYDVCCRFLMALGPDHVRATHRSAEGTSATFGATAAAASLARFDERGMRFALSYGAQQVSGLWSWTRDEDHIEKAFDFAGMGARNAVAATTMVQSGFTGVAEVLDGEHNMILALSTQPRPEEMVKDLGTRFYVSESAIKVFSVGYPIQSALDALLTLRREHKLTPENVGKIVVRLPEDGARIVDGNAMPDVNLQHLVAVALVDGTVSFEMSHSRERMADPQVLAVKARVQLVGDKALVDPAAPRSGAVEATLSDGRVVRHFTRHPPGTKENPLSAEAVAAKARDLMAPVIGAARADAVIARVNRIEDVRDARDLVRLMRRP